MSFTLISDRTGLSVFAESDGIFERIHGTTIHYRDAANTPCRCCGLTGGLWTDQEHTIQRHADACNGSPA